MDLWYIWAQETRETGATLGLVGFLIYCDGVSQYFGCLAAMTDFYVIYRNGQPERNTCRTYEVGTVLHRTFLMKYYFTS